MKLAVLSGKGGAGKTMLSVNLAASAGNALYIDCDVEEPNGRLFLKPEQVQKTPVTVRIPQFHPEQCTGCRECVDFCRFNALVYIKKNVLLFPEVCHSCGGCALVCDHDAVTETQRTVGHIERGIHGTTQVVTGILNLGESSGVPVIAQALRAAEGVEGLTVIDCPPGSACPVMESVRKADYCLLVAEPTAFGFHNFQMVHELVQLMGRPCGVVINKMTEPYEPLEQYCQERKLPVLARIGYSDAAAQIGAAGGLLCEQDPQAAAFFREILQKIGGAAL